MNTPILRLWFIFPGKTVQELDTIQSNDSLVAKIKESEIKPCKIRLKTIHYLIPKKSDKFNVKVDIPNKYKLVTHEKFMWYKKEITRFSLLFYQIPLSNY
jgi:hypothetical protein